VIFRVYPDGDVIALFPQIAAGYLGYSCQSYMHVGQHGAANPNAVIEQTKLASRKEYQVLLQELEQIGYNPIVVKRFIYKDLQIRQEQAKNW
jgi:hypothetical protein